MGDCPLVSSSKLLCTYEWKFILGVYSNIYWACLFLLVQFNSFTWTTNCTELSLSLKMTHTKRIYIWQNKHLI